MNSMVRFITSVATVLLLSTMLLSAGGQQEVEDLEPYDPDRE